MISFYRALEFPQETQSIFFCNHFFLTSKGETVIVSWVVDEGTKAVVVLSETVGWASEKVEGGAVAVGEVLETTVDTVGTTETVDEVTRTVCGVLETVDEVSGSVDGVYEAVWKTIEMIGEGAVVGLMVVDGDNVIVACSDFFDIGPKVIKQLHDYVKFRLTIKRKMMYGCNMEAWGYLLIWAE